MATNVITPDQDAIALEVQIAAPPDRVFEAITDPARRRYFLTLPTGFSLTKDQVQDLIDVGPQLLEQSPDFLEFRKSLERP